MNQAAAAPAAPVVQMIPLASIHESKSNPRKTFSGIEELAEDLKVRGLLQPVLVRAGTNGHADGYELVFGARRFRAAKLAKLAALPAFVRELNDEQTLELQIVENTQRADVHPLEEADGYRRLHEEFKYSVEEIAAKVGKSRSAVYERIKLCALVPAAREAFFAEKLSASTALLVARIPDKELQGKAVKDLVGRAGDDPMSYRDAVDHVQRNYMLQLKDAPFSTTDATLVAKAGACAACPKRTGNQRELFADVKSPDVCTDPVCYREKVDALWKLKTEKAKESGQEVLDEKKSKELFQYGQLGYNSEYQDLADKVFVGNGEKSVKSIVGKDAPTVLARNPRTGEIHELVKREVVSKAKRQSEPQRKLTPEEKKWREENAKDNAERDARAAVGAAVLGEIVKKVEAHGLNRAAWAAVAAATFHDFADSGSELGIIERRFGDDENGDKLEAFEKSIPKMQGNEALGVIVELALFGEAMWAFRRGEKGYLNDVAKALGVDEKKVAARLKAERKAAEDAKKKPPAVRAGAVCAIPGCGEPGKRTKGAPGLWCADHGSKLSAAEKKSIDDRNKRLAAEGKAVRGTSAKADRVKSSKAKSSKAKPGKTK